MSDTSFWASYGILTFSLARSTGPPGWEVARLSRLALDNMAAAVKLYVQVALSSGTDAPDACCDGKWR